MITIITNYDRVLVYKDDVRLGDEEAIKALNAHRKKNARQENKALYAGIISKIANA